MRNRFLSMILLSAIFCACEKENNHSIPELLDDNPKVLKISIPSLSLQGISGYCDIVIKYQGELISSITRPGDSISFYYTNEQLDSAKRYSNSRSISGIEFFDEHTVSFVKKNGKIIQANFKSLNFGNDTLRFHFIYNSDKLAAVKSPNSVDTLIYKNGQITDIRTYRLYQINGYILKHYGELLRNMNIKDYISRPNPYYLISNRLGFPYFSCVWDNSFGAREDYIMECKSNYEIEKINLGIKTGRSYYDYDDLGRVKTIYSSNYMDKKTLIQYQ